MISSADWEPKIGCIIPFPVFRCIKWRIWEVCEKCVWENSDRVSPSVRSQTHSLSQMINRHLLNRASIDYRQTFRRLFLLKFRSSFQAGMKEHERTRLFAPYVFVFFRPWFQVKWMIRVFPIFGPGNSDFSKLIIFTTHCGILRLLIIYMYVSSPTSMRKDKIHFEIRDGFSNLMKSAWILERPV